MRNAIWLLVMAALLISLPAVGLANHEDAEETTSGFGFGGPLIGLFTLELGGENDAETVNGILAANGYAALPERMITFGGGGGGGVIGGFSFGGSGWGGSITSIQEGKKAELSFGFGGMDIAYAVGGGERSLLLIGVVLGGGGLDLKLRDRIPVSFEDAVADPTTVTLSQGFFAAEPYVCFQVQPLSWLGFEAHLGYLFTLPGNWEEGGQEVAGPSLRLSGPFVGLSIAFGGIEGTDEEEVTEEDTPEQASPAPEGLRPDAPPYAVHGPSLVGYKPLIIDEGTDQQLDVDLWYPALNPTGATEGITYEITLKHPDLRSDAPSVVYGRALLDAPIDDSMGPYPLVVFSHGFSTNPEWYSTLLEHYASHGFIVLAPEHVEQEWSEAAPASIDRPRDIKQTLDYAEELTAPGGDMVGLIDMENVAVVGHSFGGYTALAMGGAQFDLDGFNKRYAELPPEDPNAWILMPFVGKEADMAARAGLDSVPEGLWPSLGDPRVTAIVPMSCDSFLFDEAGLSKITIPMMAIGGTADTGAPYDWGTKPSYDYASSARKALVGFVGAEHMFVSTPCENMPWTTALPFYVYKMFCLEPVWDKQRALDLIHHFSTAFLLDTLKGDADAHAALLPDAVQFPGIDYVTTLR